MRHLKHKPYKVVLSKVNESSKEVMDSTFYLSPHDCPSKKKKHGNAQFRTFLFFYTLQPVERNPVTTFSLVYANMHITATKVALMTEDSGSDLVARSFRAKNTRSLTYRGAKVV